MTVYINGTTGYSGPVGLLGDLTTTGNTILGDASTDTLNVSNGNLVLDSSGNAGLGVTPSAWDSAFTAFQLGASTTSNGNASLYSQKNGSFSAGLMTNAYYNAGWKYVATNFATRYEQNTNSNSYFAWYTAPSGTAGNAVSWTQAMTLDINGNLGIGTTSPTTKLSITDSAGPVIRMVRTSNRFEVSADTDFMSLNARDASTYITFKTADTERARIDSSGNFGIGTTSPGQHLDIAGNGQQWVKINNNNNAGANGIAGIQLWGNNTYRSALYYNDNAGATYLDTTVGSNQVLSLVSGSTLSLNATGANIINFSTNGSERARIDSSGNLMVGTTTSNGRLSVYATTNAQIALTDSTLGPNYGGVIRGFGVGGAGGRIQIGVLDNATYSKAIEVGEQANYITFTTNASERARIDSSGNFGIGTSSPSNKLVVSGSSGSTQIQLADSYASNNLILSANTSTVDIKGLNGYPMVFYTSGTERARFDTSGNMGLGRTDPPMKLGVMAAGAVINGTATIGTNMQGIQIYNATSATTNNAVGLWLTVGPHQTGIAAFRPTPDTTWATALAFYTHGNATSGLNDCYERMRISGEGNVSIGTSGENARLFVSGTSAAIALDAFKSDGFARTIQICAGLAGNYNTLTIEVNLLDAGGYCYELNTGGTSGGCMATGGGYINGSANFSHNSHLFGGTGTLTVSCPSGNIVRWVLTGGNGVHPVCTFKITGSLSQYFGPSNITVVYS
jgi:hypothetical protein